MHFNDCRSTGMNSSVATLSTENLVNELVGETTPSTSGYGSSMKVSISFVCLRLTLFLTLQSILLNLEQKELHCGW